MIVFRDLFTAGLRMPLDPVVVDIFRLFKVYLHQMTPTSIVRLNLYMWLAKTCHLSPRASLVPSGCIINRRIFLCNRPEVRRYQPFPNMAVTPSPFTRTF